ncbi:MAG: gas vesicle protein GvpO [Desulfitobacteriaceae bacterium]
MAIQNIVSEVTDFFMNILKKEAHVIGVEKRESGWLVLVETIEESEYMRKRALDDTVGLYEVEISDKMEILSYKRTGLRERGEIHQDKEE